MSKCRRQEVSKDLRRQQEVGMEAAHSLLLNEEALKRIPESKRPVFVFEWLRFLDKVLAAAHKVISESSTYFLIL